MRANKQAVFGREAWDEALGSQSELRCAVLKAFSKCPPKVALRIGEVYGSSRQFAQRLHEECDAWSCRSCDCLEGLELRKNSRRKRSRTCRNCRLLRSVQAGLDPVVHD